MNDTIYLIQIPTFYQIDPHSFSGNHLPSIWQIAIKSIEEIRNLWKENHDP